MGRKGFNISEMIENELKNGPKSGKELKRTILSKLGTETPRNTNKTFDEKLIKLIENEKIKIVGYEPDEDSRKQKSKQSFKSDPLIFDSTDRLTRPDIKKLLNQMEIDNESYQKIRELFKRKYNDFYIFQKDKWNYLSKRTFFATPEQIKKYLNVVYPDLDKIKNEVSFLSHEEENELFSKVGVRSIINMDKLINELGEGEKESELVQVVRRHFELKKDIYAAKKRLNYNSNQNLDEHNAPIVVYKSYIKSLLKILDKYEEKRNVKIWFYPYTLKEYKELYPSDTFLPSYCGFDFLPDLNIANNELIIEAINRISSDPYKVDVEGNWDKSLALGIKGFRSFSSIEENPDWAFEHIIDILFTYHKEDKETLMGILAKGLSDELGSTQIFYHFCDEIMEIDYRTRVKTVLGSLNKDS